MSRPFPQPRPVATLVCTVCGRSWFAHLQRAKDRLRLQHDEDVEISDEAAKDEVAIADCIELLKWANVTPGPPGPVGAMGRPGRDAGEGPK